MRHPSFGDGGGEARAPARERLVRSRKARQHEQVLMLAQAIAQPLRLAAPHLDEARPQRLDDVDLVTVNDDPLAQLVQVFRLGALPIPGEKASRVAVEA